MTRKKSRILKSFLATASILGLSLTIPVNEIYAAAVSQMVGDVNLNNPNTNFTPPFVDGNTIEVINSGNITVSNSGTYNIGAIRADQEVNTMSVGSGSTNLAINLTIGSMSGVVKSLHMTRFTNDTNINITLNGSAGVGDIPSVNDYSALQQVSFKQMGGGYSANSINLNINAPVTLNSTFYTSAASEIINVNSDVIITKTTTANGAGNMNFNIAGDKSLTLSAPNSIHDGTGAGRVRFNFTGANSVLNIDGTNTTIRGAITNGANGILNVNAGVTKATDSTVTTLHKTNIADSTTFNIDSVNSNMNLLNNGTSIAFKGASSELDLINTGNTDKQFTLYSNLNPSDAEDEYGIVRVEATTNNLTIANNGGPYTIGQDNTHRLKEFEVKGAGNIVIDNTIFTKQFNMNNTGQVTLNQRLDLGAEGEVLYNQPGTLNVSGDNPIIGKVNFQNVDDTLNITLNVHESFNADIDNIMPGENGIVNVIQSEDHRVVNSYIRGNIGETNPIKNLVIGNNNVQVPLNFQLDGKVKASKIQVNRTHNFNNFMRLTINNDVTADIEGVSNGSNNFVLTINQGKTVTGAINSIDTASTTINLRGSVTGPITNATTINFDGTGNTRLGSTANTTDFIVSNAKANVTADGRMIGNLSYNAAGTVAATKGITGYINFKGNDGVFNLGNGSTIDGAVTSTDSVAGSLYFIGDGEVTGGVEAKKVVFNGVDNIDGAANAEIFTVANVNTKADITGKMVGNIEYTAAGALLANGGLTGNVNFNNRGGTFYLGEGAKIIGSVTSTGGVANTLVFIGDGEATGDIGTDDENKPDIIDIAGDNTKQVTLRGNVLVNDLVFVQGVDSSGKANIERGLVARRVVFNNENADGGTLVINAPSAVNAIVNPNNGMIVLNADFTISDPSAGDIREIKIADNIKYTIDAKSGNVDLLNNGAKIIFEGAGSELNLINTGNTDKQFTLYAHLNPSNAEDEYGIVRVEATTNNLTIANNGGPYTIGQDNTHRLKAFEVKGSGNIVIDNTIFTKQLNMNNTGQVNLNQVLDLGAGGVVVFAADGKLTANNGISGSVTTATNDTGTLTIGAGNVTGAIGTNGGNKLKEVNFNGVSNVTSIDATMVKINNVAANVTAAGQISGAVSYTADGKLTANNGINGAVTTATNDTGTLTIGAGNVTGAIGTNGGNKLKEVNFNGVSNVTSIDATTVKINNVAANVTAAGQISGAVSYTADGKLTANNGISGSVTTATNDTGTLTIGAGNVIGTIGTNGKSLKLVNIGANPITFSSNVFAPVALTDQNSQLTLADGIVVTGSVTTKNNTRGVLSLGVGSSVTGGIGANGLSLERVEVGAGASSLGGNIYAGAVKLMADTSVLTLEDNAKVYGSVTTKTDTRGILVLGRNSSVAGIGANGFALERVEIGVGASSLRGNIYAGAVKLMADDSALTLEDNATIDGSVTTKTNEKGILIFSRNGSVTDNIGENGAALEKVIFTGVDTIEGAAYAQTFTIANANANVTVKGLMTGDVHYEADGTLAPEGIIGDIDFKGTNGTFSINDGRAIDGAVLSTGVVGGILNFKGNGTVSGSIGTDAENSPATINIQGDDTTNVSLANDVFVGDINFTNGGKLQLSKSLSAKNVDFGAKGGTLEFNGNDKYIFNAVIANGQTGILNFLTTLTTTDASVGTLKTINIGNANAGQSFLIAVNNANLALLTTPNSSINFGNANSQLTLTAPIDQTVTFAGSLKGTAGGGGIVVLDGNGHNLVGDGKNGAMLGTAGNELAELNIKGDVTITNNLDIHNINKLNIQKGAYFTDHSLTSTKVAEINIGQLTDKTSYAATYALDAVNGDFELNTGGMKFIHEDSVLNLKNSSKADNHTINLTGPLDSRHDKFGIIKFTTGDKNLIIANNGNDDNTLGTEGHRLKELDFVSTGNGTINLQAGINVENIVLDIHAITLNKVNANIRFEDDTIYTATGDIVGDIIDLQGKAGVINVTDNIKIDSIITSTGDTSGILNFEGAGEVTKLITNIKMLKAGNGNVALTAGGDYSIGEIQGNGNNNLTFGSNSRVTTTYINKTGGQAVNLIFTDGGSVRNAVGSNAAVGDIIVKAGAVNFGSTVKSGNIIMSNGVEIEVNDNIIATDIAGENENDGALKLNNKVPINITGTIGNNNSLGIVEVAGKDVTITGELKAQAINFSNAGQEVILTLQAAGGVTNITTAGNNLHTLAIADFDTGNGAIGTEDHRLKAIELTGNGLVTVNTKNFYSDVTTANNGKGNVKLNIEGGTNYNLGSKNNSLASVQVSENSTIKGDVYSKEINIDAGRNIDFERGDNRNAKNIIIQDVLVDRELLPRSLQLFTYLTDIKVDKLNFAAAASVHFKDAVLVNAEIDGGGAIKFNENVWLKEEIKNVERLEFDPEKFAILEKNIKAANLVANKANIVLLDNLGIEADSQFTDTALDLATYELKHTGNVTYNGTLEIITYFDVTAKSGGHILVGNGANVDMSALDSLVIKVKSRSDITKITSDTKHEVILKEAGGNFTPVAQNKVTVDTGGELNRLIRWGSDENGVVLLNNNDNGGGNPENPDPGGGDPENPGDGDSGGGNPGDGEGGVIVPIFDPKPIRDEVTGPIAPGLVEQLIGIGIGNESDAGKVLNDLGSTKNVSETLNRLGGRTDVREVSEGLGEFNIEEIQDILTDISVNMDSVVSSGINARLGEVNNKDESTFKLNGLNKPNASESLTNQAAVAAGDEDNIGTGIWGVPFYGKATQKSRNDGASGYKSKSQGGIIGFDYALSDSVIVGAAYTRADSKLRHQNYKVGDKTKAISDIYSIYGLYNCGTSNFFVEAIGSYGRSRVKNYEKRKVYTGDQTAIGKFNNTSYSGELLGGYNYLISNFTAITPMIRTRYAIFKNNSYKETGTTFQNLSVRKKSYDRFEGIAGLKGVTNFFVKDVKIKPELHGFVNYDFKGKLPNTDARLDGIDEPLTTVKFKPTKLNYNLGGSLSIQYNMMEFGIRYNLSLAKEYIANQGSLRLKVNL